MKIHDVTRSKGLRDVECKFITDKRKKSNTLMKRKEGLFKKCTFLAKMCDMQVFMAVHDPNLKKLAQYSNSDFGDLQVSAKIQDINCNVTYITPDQVENDNFGEVSLKTTKIQKKGRKTGRSEIR